MELKRPLPRGVLGAPAWPLPPGFAGPGEVPPAGLGGALQREPPPIRGLCAGKLRVLLRERGDHLVLPTDLGGGV